MADLPVYILSGGASHRFGSDKARALVKAVPQIVRLSEMVDAGPVTVVADREAKYADLGLRTIADVRPGRGPLGGLHAALVDTPETPWRLVLSCDLLVFKEHWWRHLWDARAADDAAVAYRGERWEPLLGLYHRRIRPHVEAQLDADEGAMWRLLERAGARPVPLPEDWPALIQMNTPEAHRRFCEGA